MPINFQDGSDRHFVSVVSKSGVVKPVAYFAPYQTETLKIDSVQDKSNPSFLWTWPSKLHSEGIWLQSKSGGTLAELEFLADIGTVSPSKVLSDKGVTTTTASPTSNKRFGIAFREPGSYVLLVKKGASGLTLEEAMPGETDSVVFHVPNSGSVPIPPQITRYKLGANYPFDPFSTAPNPVLVYRLAQCSIETRVFSSNDAIQGIVLDNNTTSAKVLAVVHQNSTSTSNTNEFRNTVSFNVKDILGTSNLQNFAVAVLSKQFGDVNNHRFSEKNLVLRETQAPSSKPTISIAGKTPPILLSGTTANSIAVASNTNTDSATALFVDGEFIESKKSGSGISFENFVFRDGVHNVFARVYEGDTPKDQSDPLSIEVRTGQFNVTSVVPKDFGNRIGANVLEITFSRPVSPTEVTNLKAAPASYVLVQLSTIGSKEGPFASNLVAAQSCTFESGDTKLTVSVTPSQAGLYRLTLVGSKFIDVFGNKLAGNSGKPGDNYEVILGQATANALVSDPLVPGVTRGKAPIVEYPSFISSKEQPRGFNPNDRVETRVARLYFYRDAHRVAQILNRRAQSYNRQDVTMRRQMADKARQEAESVTTQRQISERDAVDKARRTRELENQMSDAQRTLNYSLQQMQQLAVQPISDPNSEAAKRREAQLAQLELAARNNAEQVRALESKISSARDTEVSANERWQQAQRSEELSRAEQFRLETAAAHADPDTFAEGKPESVDAVHQVSISVIGEGVLHLRGPLRGVNQVRMMVDQIDSPCGQVRVNVHSTQINGEAADELETVANRIQTYIDQARFLTLQSGEMLRKAVLHTAAARAEEARGLFPGESQADRDQRYLVSFFGKDFVDELRAMDSEFLMTGNKLLSLHSMDVTSLSSALTVMALANNGTRFAIWQEFERLIQTDLSMAERQFLQNSIAECTTKKCKHGCKGTCKHNQPPPVFQLTGNATFTGLRGFFDANVPHDDTMTPLQREVIRLAQILKGRLVTELELKQRVMERAVIEERIGAVESESDQLNRERAATALLRSATEETFKIRSTLLPSLTSATAAIDPQVIAEYAKATQDVIVQFDQITKIIVSLGEGDSMGTRLNQVSKMINDAREWRSKQVADINRSVESPIVKDLGAIPGFRGIEPLHLYALKSDDPNKTADQQVYLVGDSNGKQRATLYALLGQIIERLRIVSSSISKFRPDDDLSIRLIEKLTRRFEEIRLETEEWNKKPLLSGKGKQAIISIADLELAINDIGTLISRQKQFTAKYDEIVSARNSLLAQLESLFDSRNADSLQINVATKMFQEWIGFWQKVKDFYAQSIPQSTKDNLEKTDRDFKSWYDAVSKLHAARSIAQSSRRPLDHKKFLDMLIDDLEEKYIELLEGTRAHTSNIDNYLKRLTTTLDDDFNTQFYFPVFRSVRKASQSYKVEFGQTETTNVLANNRELAKVSPSATMEFDLPKRDILIKEGIDSALAIYNDVGALVNDPNLLSLAKMQSGQSTASPGAGSLGGYGAVRNVYPGLSSDTSSRLVSQNAGSGPKFESNVEKLIPDPAIYKFETGTGYEIRPVIAPDGQAVVFDFNYMYTTQVREPVRADEKHLGRIKQHYIDTDVQLSNFELREVSRYVVALKAARTAKGVPLLEDIPVFGALWRPLPSDEKSLQQNIIMAQATIFPTLFDLMGLRWAPAVADMDPMRLSNREYLVRNRHKFLENRIYDYSSSRVDEFLRVPDPARRPDLYRSQETIPPMHPNGYQGPGLDIEVSPMRNGYDPQVPNRNDMAIPSASPEGSLYPTLRQNDVRGDGARNGRPPNGAYIEDVQPIRLDPAQSRRGSTLQSPAPAPGTSTGANADWEYSRGK